MIELKFLSIQKIKKRENCGSLKIHSQDKLPPFLELVSITFICLNRKIFVLGFFFMCMAIVPVCIPV